MNATPTADNNGITRYGVAGGTGQGGSHMPFARAVAARPGELQLVAPDGQLLWDPALDGRLRGVMLGRSWRIPKQALAAMLEQAGISCEE